MQDQIRDDAGTDRNQQEVAVVTAYPVVAMPWPAKVRAAPVLDDVGSITILDRHIATPAIPAFASTAVIHAVAIMVAIAVMTIGITVAPVIVMTVVTPVVAAIISTIISTIIAAVIAAIPVMVLIATVLALIRALVTLPHGLSHSGRAA